MFVEEYLIKKRTYLNFTYIGLLTFLFGSTFAMLIKPDYSFTNQWLSDLGTGKFGLLFNSTLVFTGIFMSMFYPLTFYLLRQKGYSKIKSIIGMLLGISSFVFLIMIGIFSLDNDVHNLHSTSTMIFLFSTSIAQMLLLSGHTWFVCLNLATTTAMDSRLSYISLMMVGFFTVLFIRGITFEQFIFQKITIYLLVLTVLYQSMKVSQSDDLFVLVT
ncbi:MAG: hypothetical protein HeimC2_25880 [Candidatus Heimdallarchaeota archaeon LC_2]|nr:MAG: hypothetical protein HeimC2_25880 [Candidatus Heimdallarchaeota archaeon LC_2]